MSEQNVEVVQRGFMATLEEDWETALGTLHPEVETHDFDIPDAGVYRVRAGKITRTEYFNDQRRALAAVGLED
jgi:ketosteroid isomerase-like protein